jgi:hypothetical protein
MTALEKLIPHEDDDHEGHDHSSSASSTVNKTTSSKRTVNRHRMEDGSRDSITVPLRSQDASLLSNTFHAGSSGSVEDLDYEDDVPISISEKSLSKHQKQSSLSSVLSWFSGTHKNEETSSLVRTSFITYIGLALHNLPGLFNILLMYFFLIEFENRGCFSCTDNCFQYEIGRFPLRCNHAA